MFDPKAYYQAAESGDEVDSGPLIEYIKSFGQIVLWGASYLGQAVAEQLLRRGIRISQFWDQRAHEIGPVHGISVVAPFTEGPNKAETLVILCVGNMIIQKALVRSLEEAGYAHLLGDHFFMGTGCKATKQRGINADACMRTMTCRFIYCNRLCNIVNDRSLKASPYPLEGEPILFTSITLVINQICSLGCKYCTSYMGTYPVKSRKNFTLERIVDDIDRFFDAVDGVGTVTVMGGEPFLHPDLGAIVQALLRKPNCGLISISTSGTCLFKKSQLEGLKDPRVNVSFSNYLASISEKQRQIFQQNVDLIRTEQVPHTVGVPMPRWKIPSTLYDQGVSEEMLIQKKQACTPRYDQLKNGKLHPCDFANTVYNLAVADYPTDYVDVEHLSSRTELRQRIREYREAPYYRTCGHCLGCGGLAAGAGEQGFEDFLTPPIALPT